MFKGNMLEVENLKKYFNVGYKKTLKAVDGVSFKVESGETLGIVGESGCGKTTLGRTIIGIYKPTSGKIIFKDENINYINKKDKAKIGNKIQMIFQDPYASLNPRMIVGDIIAEGWDINKKYKGNERKKKIVEILELVGLNEEHINRFPHEFSGGQRQRIGIGRALSMNPELIICDEPISSLDVSIQAQIMNLLLKLQKQFGFTYIFISHDLRIIKYISDNVIVIYLGKVMEHAESQVIYDYPLHPYTKVLFSAILIPNPDIEKSKKTILLEGDIPSPINPKPGCKFASRCPLVQDICTKIEPELKERKPGHFVACHIL
jgi:oligopeptide transport system ATP-binding protein